METAYLWEYRVGNNAIYCQFGAFVKSPITHNDREFHAALLCTSQNLCERINPFI